MLPASASQTARSPSPSGAYLTGRGPPLPVLPRQPPSDSGDPARPMPRAALQRADDALLQLLPQRHDARAAMALTRAHGRREARRQVERAQVGVEARPVEEADRVALGLRMHLEGEERRGGDVGGAYGRQGIDRPLAW